MALQVAGKETRQGSETHVRTDMEPKTRQRMVSRLLRFGVSGSGGSSADDPTAMGELETELALLREENAWLKVERQRPADAGRVVERMRELGKASQQPRESQDSHTSEDAQAMLECLSIRDGLLEACKEIQQAMQGIRSRLSGLSVDLHGKSGGRAVSAPVAAPTNSGVEPALSARVTSDMSQNVA